MMKITKTKIISIAGLFLSSLAYATTTYTLREVDSASATPAATMTTYVENGDGTVSSVISALTYIYVNSDASTTEGVDVSYYKWDSDTRTYVLSNAYDYSMLVYDTGDDVYQGGSTSTTGTYSGNGSGVTLSAGVALSSDFVGNSTTTTGGSAGGGAIFTDDYNFTVEGSFIGNVANVSGNSSGGGAIGVKGKTVTVTGDFLFNSAPGEKGGGGAVRWLSSGSFTAYGDFIGNYAGVYGGAICFAGTGALKVTGDFISNLADGEGGAIYFAGSGTSNTLTDGSFYSNSAGTQGGALYVATGTVTVYASTKNVYFTGNTDSTGSNAIYNKSTVAFNAAETYSIVVNDGIDGDSGKMNILGAGTTVFNNTVANQTITINDAATLALGSVVVDGVGYSANLVNSTITVNGTLTVSSLSLDSTSSLVFGSGASFDLVDDAVISVYLGSESSYTFAEFDSETELNAFLTEMGIDVNGDSLESSSLIVYSDEDVALAYGDDYQLSISDNSILINNLGAAVPEPSTYAMIIGILSLGFAYYRRRN